MDLGSLELQIFVSLVVVLGTAFVALVCDFLKGNNEQLRERNVELRVRQDEREKLQAYQPAMWLQGVATLARHPQLIESMASVLGGGTAAQTATATGQPVDAPDAATTARVALQEGAERAARRPAFQGDDIAPAQPAVEQAWAKPEEMDELASRAARIRVRYEESRARREMQPKKAAVEAETAVADQPAVETASAITAPALAAYSARQEAATEPEAAGPSEQVLPDIASVPAPVVETARPPAVEAVVESAGPAHALPLREETPELTSTPELAAGQLETPLEVSTADTYEIAPGHTQPEQVFSAVTEGEAAAEAACTAPESDAGVEEEPARETESLQFSLLKAKVLPINVMLAERYELRGRKELEAELERVASLLAPARSEKPATEAEADASAVEAAAVESAATPLAQDEIPAGFHPAEALAALSERNAPFQGAAVAIGINDMAGVKEKLDEQAQRQMSESLDRLVQSMLRAQDFACRSSEDEFVLLFPGESGSAAQRRLFQVSERLWDYQLRTLGDVSVMFSWGGLEIQGDSVTEAVASARERMYQTKRNRKSAPVDFSVSKKRVVNG